MQMLSRKEHSLSSGFALLFTRSRRQHANRAMGRLLQCTVRSMLHSQPVMLVRAC